MGIGTREEFSVDENGLTSDGYRRLEPVSRKSMYIGRFLAIIISALLFIPCILYLPDVVPVPFVKASLIILLGIIVLYCLVSPIVFYRRYRYRIDEDKVEIRRGIVYVRHEMVPVERIHQVEVVRGPINRMFGLADVNITTAGGNVTIQFLEGSVAEDIANNLNDKVVVMLRKRDRCLTAYSVTISR